MVKNTKDIDFNLKLEFSKYFNDIIKSLVSESELWTIHSENYDGNIVNDDSILYFNLEDKKIFVSKETYAEIKKLTFKGLQVNRLRLIGFLPRELVYSCNMDYSNLLNVINNDIELKSEVFKNLSKILFNIFNADKFENSKQYEKLLTLQKTPPSYNREYREVFVDCLRQIESFDSRLLEICKKIFSQGIEKRNTLVAEIYLNMVEIDDWNTYSIKDLEMFFEKRVIQKSFAYLRSYLPYTFNYERAPFLYLKVRELHDYLLSDTDQLTDDYIYRIKNFFIYIFFCYFDKERKDVTFSNILSGYFRENELKTPGIPESPFNVYIFHKKIRRDLHDFMKIALEYLIERSEDGRVQFNLSNYSHKDINVEKKNGCKTFHTIKSFYEDFIWFIKKLQRDNPDLLEKIDFTYDSKREFSKVLNFKNYSNFNREFSDDEYFYYRIAKILCKTFDFFSEIMKDNDKTELELLQKEVALYRDQVEFYKKLKKNK